MKTAKEIVEWLREKLGNDTRPYGNQMWVEHEYAFGDSETGFDSAYTIDFSRLEEEMDAWIKQTFPKEKP